MKYLIVNADDFGWCAGVNRRIVEAHRSTRTATSTSFPALASFRGIPLRRYPRVRHISRLYGQWAGEHHPEEVSVPALIQILATDVGDGVTELGCHSGCADPALVSSYRRLARRSRRSRRSSTAIWSQPRTAARSGIRRRCGPYWRRPDRKPPRTVVASMGNP